LRFGWITFVDGDRTVDVTWGDVGLDDVERIARTEKEARSLERLDVRLGDLGSWLPASAWVDQEPKPFVPLRYSVCYETEEQIGLDAVLASLPQRAEDLLRTWDRSHEVVGPFNAFGSPIEIWCSVVTTDEARVLAEIFDDADTADGVNRDVFGLRYEFGQRDPGEADVTATFEPMLPNER